MAKTSCPSFSESYPMALWNDILGCHYNYIATDESLEKLQERENLEDLLKEFLCIVPQDRKFFLPETKHVLKRSVAHMEDFSAYEASIGFDAISQYANNLLAKPWRKEYKTIKIYSGFYQHEVENNLIDAVKMFEAMGYTQLDNETLVLQGPICFDQVANVSRDAMAAYVECQIMKEICAGLIKMKFSSKWIDIFNFREKYTGDASHAITAIANRISDKHRAQKIDVMASSACKACNVNRSQSTKPIYDQPAAYNTACSLHYVNQQVNNHQPLQQQHHLSYGYPPHLPMQPPIINHHHPASIPHSKSLEHYVDYSTVQHPHFGIHSLSLDQHTTYAPIGQSPPQQQQQQQQQLQSHHYDTVDGATAATAYQPAVCSHANYNVSGIRYPIPLNVSNQFIAEQYGVQANVVPCSGSSGYPLPPSKYAYVPQPPTSTYSQLPNDRHYGQQTLINATNSRNNVRVDHLIDLDDHRSTHHYQPAASPQNVYSSMRHTDDRQIMEPITLLDKKHELSGPTSYAQAIKLGTGVPAPAQFNNLHHDTYNKGSRIIEKPNGSTDPATYASKSYYDQPKYSKSNSRLVPDYEQVSPVAPTIESRNSRASDFDSVDDSGDFSLHRDHRGAQSSKNHDGVGSFEQWSFVYQTLAKQGYSKDLGERGDLSVQGLDLNPPGISGANTADKKLIRAQEIVNKTATAAPLTRHNGEQSDHRDEVNKKPEAPQRNGSTLSRKSVIYANPKSNGEPPSSNGATHRRAKSYVSIDASAPIKSGNKASKAGNGIVPTSTTDPLAEWSCQFCTFLNPGTIRICKICAKSKDFRDSTSKATTTCV